MQVTLQRLKIIEIFIDISIIQGFAFTGEKSTVADEVGRYIGILSYLRYLVDTGMAVLVLTLYQYTVIGGILQYIPVSWLSLVYHF
jgi:hypothetical protein